jgi:hypothetical protein
MLAYITGIVDQELLLRNEYLAAENRILKAQIKGRLLLSEADKATLAEIAHRLGRKALEEVAAAAKPDTAHFHLDISYKHLNHRQLTPSPWRVHHAPGGHIPRSPPLPHHFLSLIARRFELAARKANLNNQSPSLGQNVQIPASWPLLQIPAQGPFFIVKSW